MLYSENKCPKDVKINVRNNGCTTYPRNGLDLNGLAVGLTVMLSQDNTVAHRTAHGKSDYSNGGNTVCFPLCIAEQSSPLLTTHGSEQQ